MKTKLFSRGFTLIELLVVIAIIGILASVVLASLSSARANARDAQRLSQIKEVQKALDLYYFANDGQYPPTGAIPSGGVLAAISGDLVPSYISTIPLDPVEGNTTTGYRYGSAGTSGYVIMVQFETDAHNAWCTFTGGTGFTTFDPNGSTRLPSTDPDCSI